MSAAEPRESKLIGMIGGISPFSTTYYYELMNGLARERLGARHSARCLVHAVDFAGVEAMHVAKDWPGVTRILCDAARSLEAGPTGSNAFSSRSTASTQRRRTPGSPATGTRCPT